MAAPGPFSSPLSSPEPQKTSVAVNPIRAQVETEQGPVFHGRTEDGEVELDTQDGDGSLGLPYSAWTTTTTTMAGGGEHSVGLPSTVVTAPTPTLPNTPPVPLQMPNTNHRTTAKMSMSLPPTQPPSTTSNSAHSISTVPTSPQRKPRNQHQLHSPIDDTSRALVAEMIDSGHPKRGTHSRRGSRGSNNSRGGSRGSPKSRGSAHSRRGSVTGRGSSVGTSISAGDGVVSQGPAVGQRRSSRTPAPAEPTVQGMHLRRSSRGSTAEHAIVEDHESEDANTSPLGLGETSTLGLGRPRRASTVSDQQSMDTIEEIPEPIQGVLGHSGGERMLFSNAIETAAYHQDLDQRPENQSGFKEQSALHGHEPPSHEPELVPGAEPTGKHDLAPHERQDPESNKRSRDKDMVQQDKEPAQPHKEPAHKYDNSTHATDLYPEPEGSARSTPDPLSYPPPRQTPTKSRSHSSQSTHSGTVQSSTMQHPGIVAPIQPRPKKSGKGRASNLLVPSSADGETEDLSMEGESTEGSKTTHGRGSSRTLVPAPTRGVDPLLGHARRGSRSLKTGVPVSGMVDPNILGEDVAVEIHEPPVPAEQEPAAFRMEETPSKSRSKKAASGGKSSGKRKRVDKDDEAFYPTLSQAKAEESPSRSQSKAREVHSSMSQSKMKDSYSSHTQSKQTGGYNEYGHQQSYPPASMGYPVQHNPYPPEARQYGVQSNGNYAYGQERQYSSYTSHQPHQSHSQVYPEHQPHEEYHPTAKRQRVDAYYPAHHPEASQKERTYSPAPRAPMASGSRRDQPFAMRYDASLSLPLEQPPAVIQHDPAETERMKRLAEEGRNTLRLQEDAKREEGRDQSGKDSWMDAWKSGSGLQHPSLPQPPPQPSYSSLQYQSTAQQHPKSLEPVYNRHQQSNFEQASQHLQTSSQYLPNQSQYSQFQFQHAHFTPQSQKVQYSTERPQWPSQPFRPQEAVYPQHEQHWEHNQGVAQRNAEEPVHGQVSGRASAMSGVNDNLGVPPEDKKATGQMFNDESFQISTPETFALAADAMPLSDANANIVDDTPTKTKNKRIRRPPKNREVTMEDIPQFPKDMVREKEKEREDVDKDKEAGDEEEDEESKGFPTEPNWEQVFFGRWNIKAWYFSPYPPMELDWRRWEEEKEKELSNPNYAANFSNNGRFTKGNQMSGRKAAAMRKRGQSVFTEDAADGNRSDSVKATVVARKEEPTHAKGNTLWVCDRCFKYCDRPLEGFGRSDGSFVPPHSAVDCTVRRPPGTLMYDDGRFDEPIKAGADATKAPVNLEMGKSVHPSNSTADAGFANGHPTTVAHPPYTSLDQNAPYPGSAHPHSTFSAAVPFASTNAQFTLTSLLAPNNQYSASSTSGQFGPAQVDHAPPATTNVLQASSIPGTNWAPNAPEPSAFPLSQASFDPPYSPMDPLPHGRFDTPSSDGQGMHRDPSGQVMAQNTHHNQGYPSTGVYGHTESGSSKLRHVMQHEPPVLPQEREGRRRIYEIDSGKRPEHKLFCQNLALFGKLFLKDKFIFYECQDFIFYIITSVQKGVESVVGFFTKEKDLTNEHNLACIIVFPPYQNKGFGSLMIKFSYELSKRDGKVGSPEKPLSDLGLRSYYTVWANLILDFILEQNKVNRLLLDRSKGKRSLKQPKLLGSNRSIDIVESYQDGSAHVHLSFECTLQQLADAAFLTVADASFALGEIGIVWYSRGGAKEKDSEMKDGSADGEQKMVLTRDLIQRIAERWRFRKAPLNTEHLLF